MLSKIHNDPQIEELTLWLHFSQIPGIGPIKGAKFLQKYSLVDLAGFSQEQLLRIGLTPEQANFWLQINSDTYQPTLLWLEQPGHQIIHLDSDHYPDLLRTIPAAPLLLFTSGNTELLYQQQIAMVGSRHPSPDGCYAAKVLTQELVQYGLNITSGLAQGIDTICHQTAVQAGGYTIAVQGCGLNHIYPYKNRGIAKEILDSGGLLVSEFLPNIRPRAEHFPRRNRIISGLSLGSVVVEAAEKSGSLITARYAVEQNREVFAVPGRFGGSSNGCNQLIQEGAKLVSKTVDILDELQINFLHSSSNESVMKETSEDVSNLPFSELLDNVRVNEPISIDVLAERSQLSVPEVMNAVISLELEGIIASVPGGYVRTRSN